MSDIAIVGLAGRFPGAKNIQEFWKNLCDGRETTSFFTKEELAAAGVSQELLNDPNYVMASPTLEGVELFDAEFFGYSRREAEFMDPQQRILLECAWATMENAGYSSQLYSGSIGMFAGSGGVVTSYLLQCLDAHPEMRGKTGNFQHLGNDKDFLATRVSYKLNLRGPSVAIQSACSTSLVAVHMACQSVLSGECDMAMAGGISVRIPQQTGYLRQEGDIYSKDGHCRAFDADASGIVFGSGAGLVMVKRLEDAIQDGDQIYAVIKGSALNNDGGSKMSYTASSSTGQVRCMTEALTLADVDPATIQYVEAHGTGTAMGDPVEISALTQTFRRWTENSSYCAIASVKTNLGHLDVAAGITSLIKVVLSLHNKKIPPTINFKTPNPKIDFQKTPFFVNLQLTEWNRKDQPRRAAINGLGIGGTNAFFVLEEAPEQVEREKSKDRDAHLLVLSGKTTNALLDVARNYERHLREHKDYNIADMCFTTAIGRDHFDKRLALVGTSTADLQIKIQDWLKSKENPASNSTKTENESQSSDVVFAFAEFSAAKATPALLNLYQTQDIFRQELNKCDEILKSLLGGESNLLNSLLLAGEKALGILESFAIQYSVAKMFESFGIVPAALSGDVNGLVFANSFAGAISLENAFKLVKAKLVSSPKLDQIVNSLKYETARYPILSNETDSIENKNQTAATKLAKILSWSAVLTDLGDFYSRGCEINWLNYESSMPKRQRLSLPTYPFQRKKYWIEASKLQASAGIPEKTEPQSQLNHPILKKSVELFDGKTVFTGILGAAHSALLSSHVVFGKMIVPGAQFVDLAAFCISQASKTESHCLNDVHFIAPLIVEKNEIVEVQLVVDLKNSVQTVEIFSRKQGLTLASAWVKHCRGTIGVAQVTSSDKIGLQSLQLKMNQMQKLTAPELIYPAFRKIGLTYGGGFQGIKEAWVSNDKNEVISRIEVQNNENHSWKINPMVLDSVFQSCLLSQLDANTNFKTSLAIVPHSISEIQFKESKNSTSYICHIKTLDKNVWDIQLFTEQAEIVLSAKSYAGFETTETQLIGHASNTLASENIATWIYKENWQLQQFVEAESIKSQTLSENQVWLLICGESAFSAPFISALSNRKIEVVKVQLAQKEDVLKSINLITSKYPKKYFNKVVSLLSLDAVEITQNLSESEISHQFYLSYGRNLHVIQSLTQDEYFEKSDLILVNQNGASIEDVYTATLSQSGILALAKTFRSEWPNRSCRFINLNTAIAAKDQLAKYLVTEILSESKEDINYSGGQRHVLRLKRQVLETSTNKTNLTEATCLITGGLGGLGFVVAQEYAEQGISSIVLVGRSEPPQEFQNQVAEFAAKGTRLTYLRGDVSVQAQVSEIFSKITELNLPAVKVIVHTAGKLQDAFLKNQTWESYVEVFKPKVLGAWNLHLESLKLVKPVEQFILFSSISPLFGNHGQANYSAANAFLDQLAIVRKNIGQAATSVAWGPWSQVGMASSLTQNEAQNLNDSGFGFLAPINAKLALKQVLSDEFRHADIAIFDLDWNKFFAARENETSNTYYHEFNTGLKVESPQVATIVAAPTQAVASAAAEVPLVKPAPVKPSIEKSKVREICEKTLRRVIALDDNYEMDSKKSFSNMGMDSLLSVEYISQIKSEMAKIATGFSISPTVIYNYPNLHTFTEFIFNKLATAVAIVPAQAEPVKPVATVAPPITPIVPVAAPITPAPAVAPVAAARVAAPILAPQVTSVPNDLENSIAIVGMGCRFPGGSNSVDEYWDYLVKGTSAISEIPIDRWDINEHYSEDKEQPGKSYARTGGFLTGIDIKSFDAGFFEISEAAAKGMDPQLRMLMEVTWDALENAGQAPGGLFESKAGIYVGSMLADYIEIVRGSQDADDLEMYNGSLASADTLAGRLAYYLGSFGPTVHTNTACSSSLVAIHLACQALKSGECNIAIAGGVNALLSPTGYSWISKLGVLSASGQSYSFDKRADGYVRAEGCGMIVLKRYADAIANRDQIIGVVRGTAAGHGGRASSPTAPNGLAQEVLIADTLRAAGVEPSQVGYLEAHATATLLGDPIEINAASNVFATGRTPSDTLVLGSAKGNFGHMEGAAGVAGLIRAVLSLKHKMVPPQANFNVLNPNIQLGESNIIIPKMLTPFPLLKGRRVASISSFGMSGIMAHAVLEEAPQHLTQSKTPNSDNQLLVLSSRSEAGLRELAGRYVNFLKANPQVNLADMCFTAATGRDHHEHRLTIAGNSVETFLSHLTNWLSTSETERGVSYKKLSVSQLKNDNEIKTAFLFSGQGSQYVGMAKKLYAAQPAFQKALNQCADILKKHLDQPLLNLIFEGEDESSLLHQTRYTQPALFAIEYSLSEMWKSFGITPTAVMGHSVGELVGACVAGVFSLEDGLMLICRRAELMQTVGGQGSMAAVMCAPAQVIEVLALNGNKVSVAAINGPTSVTISGYVNDLDEVLLHFEKNKIMFKRLTVSHAFHSKQMDEMLNEFTQSARKVRFSPPQIALVSNVDGQLVTTQVCEPEYWAQHLRKAVMFAEGIKTLAGMGIKNYLEMGPGATLVGMATPCLPENNDAQLFSSLRRGREDGVDLLECLGSLHTQGYKINWENFYSEMPELRRISLPTYAFQRKTYWVEKKIEAAVKPILTIARKAETFLGERNQLLTNSTEIVFESVISLETHDFLNHHLVFDAAIVPGATYLEMSSSAALQIYGQGVHGVEDLIIHQALVIKRNEKTLLRTRVEKTGENKAQWTIQSQILSTTCEENKWTTHVTGQLSAFVPSQGATQTLAEVLKLCDREISAQDHYAVFAKQGIPYGSEFKVVRRVKVGGTQVIGEVELQEKLAKNCSQYLMHPAMLDGCLQVGNSIITEIIGSNGKPFALYLPFSFDSWQFFQYSGGPVWCQAIHRGALRLDQPIQMDLIVFDSKGKLVAKASGYCAVEANPSALLKTSPSSESELKKDIYELVWKSSAITSVKKDIKVQETWIVFADQSSLCRSTINSAESAGANVVKVYASGPSDEASNIFTLDPSQSDDYQQLLSKILQKISGQFPLKRIVHCWSSIPSSSSNLELKQKFGFESVLGLVKALVNSNKQLTGLYILTREGQSEVDQLDFEALPQSLCWGLGRGLNVEHPELNTKLIDVGSETSSPPNLLNEILDTNLEQEIILKGSQRWVKRLERKNVQFKADTLNLTADATYVVTGGLGGLGFALAQKLAERGAKNLVLLGRNEPKPEINDWIAKVKTAGTQVVVKKLDIADFAASKDVFSRLKTEMPPVKGFFHAAGVSDMQNIAQLSRESFQKVFQAKIQGAWNLHQLSQELNLDYFVMFSSAAAFMPAAGQAAYAAANTFVDSLIQARRYSNQVGHSFNWGIWAEVGMAAKNNDEAMWAKGGMSGIPLQEGMDLLTKLIQIPQRQLTIMSVKWEQFAKTLDEAAELTFFSGLLTAPTVAAPKQAPVQAQTQVQAKVEAPSGPQSNLQMKLQGSTEGERKAVIVQYLVEQMGKLIANSNGKIDPQEGLMAQGLDSLGSIELRNRLKKDLKIPFPPTLIFNYPSIEVLSDFILTQLPAFTEVETQVETPKQTQVKVEAPAGPQSHLLMKLQASTEGERKAVVVQYLVEQMGKLIANSNGRIDTQEGLMAQGLDSLGSIELRNRLKKDLKIPFPPTLIFNYPSIEVLSDFILTQLPAFTEMETQVETFEPVKKIEVPTDKNAIAIIGVGCRYPGDVNSLESFWNVLSKGVDTLTDIPKSRFDIDQYYNADPSEKGKIYLKRGSFINFDKLQNFDAKFFGLSPAEAKLLDPAQRLLLETVWEAIENAGEIPKNLVGSKTGVFIGDMYHDYSELIAKSEKSASDEMYSIMGGGMSAVAGRISYTMGFEGPSVTLDTACSSSLVAIHLACDALRNGSADRAIAGGVNVILTPTGYVGMSRTKAFSFEGRCATFDESADGYVRGEGCGVILLKRLDDAIRDKNPILGIVRGSAVNQDGKSVTMTAPNGLAQERLIKAALSQANLKPHEVSYLEAHGTGTSLGDPIESQAFGNVLKEGRTSENPLHVGSVKTNFGHTEAAAGVAGVIKVLLAMQHRELPPNLHFKKLNSKINLDVVPAKVVTQSTPWKTSGKLVAGISSFGISGTNAHVIIEEPPKQMQPRAAAQAQINESLLCLSARDSQALHDLADHYVTYLKQSGPAISLADICYSAATTRSNFGFRLSVTGSNKEEIINLLQDFKLNRKVSGILFNETENSADSKKIGFLYPNQNSYYMGLGSQLYQSVPAFRKAINTCAEMAKRYNTSSIIEMMEKKNSGKTSEQQIQLFAIQYALAEMWKSYGLQPSLIMGYGIGEFTAACSAGIFTLEEGIRLVCAFAEVDKGSMGYNEQIKNYERILGEINLKKPSLPFYSGDSGQRISANDLTKKEYWTILVNAKASGGSELLKLTPEGVSNYLVIGSEVGVKTNYSWTSLASHADDKSQITKVISHLFNLGVAVDWEAFTNANAESRKVALPNYPFQRKHFWVDAPSSSQPEQTLKPATVKPNPAETKFVTELTQSPPDQRYQVVAEMLKSQIVKILALDKSKTIDENKNFSDLGLDSLTLVNLNSELKSVFAENLKITHNILFEKPTVRKLAEYICSEIFPKEKNSEKTELQIIKTSSESWIKIWDPKPDATFRIFCFHYAGGSALMYKDWCQHLPPEVELCAVQLPGRWERSDEPMQSLAELMGPMTDSIVELMDKPFAFFGYSMGGAFAFEALRELRRRGSALPVHLFAAACSPPQLHLGSPAASFGPMSDEAFIRKFKNIFGTIYGEKEMLESSMKDTWIGVLRNDMNALSTYSYQAEKAFQTPITAMSGSSDQTLPVSVLEQWKAQTNSDFTPQVFKGGHLFIHEVPTEELVEFVLNKISLLRRDKAV